MTDTSDQTGKRHPDAEQNDGQYDGQNDEQSEGTVDDAERDTPQADRPDPTQELWSTDRTEQISAARAGDEVPDGAAPTAVQESTPAAAATPAPWPPPVPPRPTGPHAPAIVLGLVCLAIAAVVLAQELGNLSVDWGDIGPLGFVAVGAVLVLLGAVGLISSQRRGSRP